MKYYLLTNQYIIGFWPFIRIAPAKGEEVENEQISHLAEKSKGVTKNQAT